MKTFLSLFLVASATSIPLLLDSSLKGLALLVLTGVIVFAFRRSSASLRHLLWTSALGSLLLLPLLSLILPEWNILPAPKSAAPALVSTSESSELVPLPAPAPLEELSFAPTATHSPTLPEVKPVAIPEPSPALQLTLKDWCFAIWALGTLFFLSRLGCNTLLTGHRNKSSNNSSNQIQERVDQLAQDFGIRRKVRVQFGLSKSMPMTCGILRPQLRLPLEASTWEPSHLRTVLLHELAHVKRHDVLTQLLVKLTCALYWFNPLVWIVSHRIELEREKACDDLVLAKGIQPADYAESLLQVISQTQPDLSNPVGLAMARPSTLETRMKAILAQHLNRRLSKKACFLVTLLGITLVLPIAMLASAQAETKPPQANPSQGKNKNDSSDSPPLKESSLEFIYPVEGDQEAFKKTTRFVEAPQESNTETDGIDSDKKEASEKPKRVPEFSEYQKIQKRLSENERRAKTLRGLYTGAHPELKNIAQQIQRDEQLLKDIRFKQSALEAQVPDALLQNLNPLIDNAGIGVLFYNDPNVYPIVAMIFPEYPAAKELREGDRIHSFRNSDSEAWVQLQYLKSETIAKVLRGPEGSQIQLMISRDKGTPFKVLLKRERMPADSPEPAKPQTKTETSGRTDQLLSEAAEMRTEEDQLQKILQLEEALRLSPNNPDALYRLAKSYELMGVESKAVTFYQKVVALGPKEKSILYQNALSKIQLSEQGKLISSPSEPLSDSLNSNDGSGIGVELDFLRDDGYPTVKSLLPELSAAKQLKVGDRIISCRNAGTDKWIQLQNLESDTIVKALRGPSGSFVEVTFARDGTPAQKVTLERKKFPRNPARIIRTTALEFLDAKELANKLNHLKLFSSEIEADARMNALIIKGETSIIANIERIVAQLDQPGEIQKITVRTYPLRHVKAEKMAEELRLLNIPSATIKPYEMSNALLLKGSPSSVLALHQRLAELDIPPPKDGTNAEISLQERLLKVELEMDSATWRGLGEQHPQTLATKAEFETLQKVPNLRNEEYYKLLDEKIPTLQANLTALTASGLSHRHPEVLKAQAQLKIANDLKRAPKQGS